MTVLRKVGIIGIGHVGAHVANAVLSAGLAEELKLCDINEQKVVSECQDLSDTLGFYPHNCVIGNYGTQYEQLADCDVVINAAGDVKTSAKDRDGELFVTTDIARTWISRLFNAGFHGVIITISNPCDVVATEIWHITGYDPRKIIGTGTALDSARLRNAIAKRVNVDQRSIGAYMLGEHGNSQFAYWSNVNIACIAVFRTESSQFLLIPMVMCRTRILLPGICVSCIKSVGYRKITTCTPCGISTQPICCRKAPANRWRHRCSVMQIRRSWNAPTAIRRTWRNSRPQS